MNTQDIEQIEKNRVIAVFMGYEPYEDRYGIWFKKDGLIKCLHIKLQDLQYHSDWSWLMPVWIKFRNVALDNKEYSDWLNSLSYYLCSSDEPGRFAERLYYAIVWYKKNV